jgi:hypothetical protein
MTPTQRTLAHFREEGMVCHIVERWNPHTRQRADYLGFIDIIGLTGEGIYGIQSCGQAFSAHYRKITEECRENAELWLTAGGRIVLCGWRKVKVKRGGKRMTWKPRVIHITLEDLKNANQTQ